MKEIIGLVAVGLSFGATIPYIVDILRGKTKPHLFSILIWTIVTGIAYFGQVAAGAGPGAWTTGAMSAMSAVVLLFCFRYGTKDITKLDFAFLIGALAAIVPWLLTKDPTLSVIFATFIDVCAFWPTIRKTFNDPTSESLLAWTVNLVRHGLALFALASFTLTTAVYPAALFLMNIAVLGTILTRKKKLA